MACDLVITSVTPHSPTSPGGFGYVEIAFTTSDLYVLFAVAGVVSTNFDVVQNAGIVYAQLLPTGAYTYSLSRQDDPNCLLTGSFTIDAAAPLVDPSLNDAPRWEPVGGVLPNPVLLKVEATLTDALGATRPGLHAEVELWQAGQLVPFAEFRATIRTATQYVNAAPYLRAELVAAQRYAATSTQPLIDQDASLHFYYRYRVVDSSGEEGWLTRAGERHAVLAALPGAADTMAPFVADGTGRVASIFGDDEATQFVGFPLEVSVLLPSSTSTRYAEWRYLSASRQELEIRSYSLAPTVPAGVLRIPLPANPLPLAAFVEVAIVDTDRSNAGATPATGFLLTNTGRLRL
jgi:hypothetical protein